MENTLKTAVGDILLDNFEYWDSSLNNGWNLEEPDYIQFMEWGLATEKYRGFWMTAEEYIV